MAVGERRVPAIVHLRTVAPCTPHSIFNGRYRVEYTGTYILWIESVYTQMPKRMKDMYGVT